MKNHTRTLISAIKNDIDHAPKYGCEVGVLRGENSYNLLSAFRYLNLLMVDRWESMPAKEGGEDSKMNAIEDWNSVLLQAKNRTEEFSKRRSLFVGDSASASKVVSDGLFDFVFIDAHHSYEACLFDIVTWFPKVQKGGILSGHCHYGSRWFGVTEAVDLYAKQNDLTVQTGPGRVWWIKIPGKV